LTSVLPVVLMGIRWRTSVGDVNAAGSFLTNLAFRVIHLFFLGACLWILFDPPYSPRMLGRGLTYLTYYYLGALVIGYYAGYALLVFTDPPRKSRLRENNFGRLFNPVVRFAVLAAVLLVPAGLVYKNFAPVRGDNGAVLKEFTERLAASLPPGPAYLLSDDSYALALLQAHLGATAKAGDYVMVNTTSLEIPAYHEKLNRRYGERWTMPGTLEELGLRIPQPDVQMFVRNLASSNVVAYIHPSFGYFFEALYAKPSGQSYRLQPFTREQVLPPQLTTQEVRANDEYWAGTGEYLKKVVELRAAKSIDAGYAAHYYSRGLNNWGVHVQRSGRVADAGKHFSEAYNLNTNNVAARANRDFNQSLQSGKPHAADPEAMTEEKFGGYRSWDALLAENGPYDHPDFCEILGINLLSQTQYRQAALQFSRTIAFQPTNFNARISFVKCLVGGVWLDEAMAELDRMSTEFSDLAEANKVDMANVRATIHFQKNDFAKAEQTLKTAKEALPEQTALGESLFELYRAAGKYTNAMELINEQLQKTPTNIVIHLQKVELQMGARDFRGVHESLDKVLTLAPKNVPAQLYRAFAYIQEADYDRAISTVDRILREDADNSQALLYKGIAHLEKKQYDQARSAFDKVIAEQADNLAALRNRAILHLRGQRWSEAKDDYEQLRKLMPKSHAVMYGLGEIAFNQNKREEAKRYYQAYLKYAPAEGGPELDQEKKRVQERLQQLQTPGK
jgi:tetratricopeptide (TPR) repeat protein